MHPPSKVNKQNKFQFDIISTFLNSKSHNSNKLEMCVWVSACVCVCVCVRARM